MTYWGMALTVLAPGEVEIGTMPAGRIGIAGAEGLAAGAGGGGETALNHGLGGDRELFRERIRTHLTQVGQPDLPFLSRTGPWQQALRRTGRLEAFDGG